MHPAAMSCRYCPTSLQIDRAPGAIQRAQVVQAECPVQVQRGIVDLQRAVVVPTPQQRQLAAGGMNQAFVGKRAIAAGVDPQHLSRHVRQDRSPVDQEAVPADKKHAADHRATTADSQILAQRQRRASLHRQIPFRTATRFELDRATTANRLRRVGDQTGVGAADRDRAVDRHAVAQSQIAHYWPTMPGRR